ncbi:MAG TPA: ABC transporter substrate-binding protein [Stellaceae bacterium]|jgi:ABC-type nitrate/sulfonate/bicarbonate transport system substrate-binding protein|nr:ABC transporter substrate-binding protein [Stellaceae bacterium]
MKHIAVVLAALTAGLLPSGALAATKLEVSLFPSAGWVLHIGQAQGLFAKEGLDVHPDPITSSIAQITGMMDGQFDLGLTALDNVIAYDAGQGAAPLKEKADLFAFMGGEGGSLHLITAHDIKAVAALKGKPVAVDAKTTGFAFVLYHMLELKGLHQSDYELVAVGSSQKRYQALLDGKAVGALLDRPFDGFAEAKGFNDLGNMREALPHYQSSVGMARRAWAKQHRAELVSFIRGYVAAGRWLFDKRNKDAAIGVLMNTTPNLTREGAERIYTDTTGQSSTTSATAKLDPKGVATVVSLRSRYGEPKRKLDAKQFYDLSYYRAALKAK